MTDSLGRRIGRYRTELRLTQAELASRVAISRVALSNLESGRSTPGERTVALLAGVFGCEAVDLVAGTEYPAAKTERLPAVVARYTEVEHRLALLERDLMWLEGAPGPVARRVVATWRHDLAAMHTATVDDHQRSLLSAAIDRVSRL